MPGEQIVPLQATDAQADKVEVLVTPPVKEQDGHHPARFMHGAGVQRFLTGKSVAAVKVEQAAAHIQKGIHRLRCLFSSCLCVGAQLMPE